MSDGRERCSAFCYTALWPQAEDEADYGPGTAGNPPCLFLCYRVCFQEGLCFAAAGYMRRKQRAEKPVEEASETTDKRIGQDARLEGAVLLSVVSASSACVFHTMACSMRDGAV